MKKGILILIIAMISLFTMIWFSCNPISNGNLDIEQNFNVLDENDAVRACALDKSVRVFWLKPSDVAFDQKVVDGLSKVMLEAQRYYKQEMGKTFTLNNPVVEVCNGDHNAK